MDRTWTQWLSLGGLVVLAAGLGGLLAFATSLIHHSASGGLGGA